LDSNSITLIDVRNRTELNTVGQIPGSVCLPLHEIEVAMELSSEQFLEKYNFAKPSPDDRKIVLTCRSGKRVLVRIVFSYFRATLSTLSSECFKVSLLQLL
jgi:rhodanese-related sulfurtransferase